MELRPRETKDFKSGEAGPPGHIVVCRVDPVSGFVGTSNTGSESGSAANCYGLSANGIARSASTSDCLESAKGLSTVAHVADGLFTSSKRRRRSDPT